jgi:hypothetical protein
MSKGRIRYIGIIQFFTANKSNTGLFIADFSESNLDFDQCQPAEKTRTLEWEGQTS